MQGRQQAETLVDQAQRIMRESEKLVERREAQAKQMEQFVEQRGTILNAMLRDEASPLRLFEFARVLGRPEGHS